MFAAKSVQYKTTLKLGYMEKFRVHDESLNSYGFWLLTAGGNLEDFYKNPLCLWNHTYGWSDKNDIILPIGIWKDIEIKKDGSIEMTAELDEDDDFALKIKKKVDKKHLRATSIGVTILEWSEDPKYLKVGQTRPTVVKWKLREVSIVDIPSNKNAVMLGDTQVTFFDKTGNVMNFGKGSENSLPLLLSNKEKIDSTMELKDVNKILGLPDTAGLADVQTKLSAVMSENVTLKSENDEFKKAEEAKVVALVETTLSEAIVAKKINETQKETFRALLKADFENGNKALQAMNTQVSLSEITTGGEQGKGGMVRNSQGILVLNGQTYNELTKTDKGSAVLRQLKVTDEAAFLEFQKG